MALVQCCPLDRNPGKRPVEEEDRAARARIWRRPGQRLLPGMAKTTEVEKGVWTTGHQELSSRGQRLAQTLPAKLVQAEVGQLFKILECWVEHP